MCGRYVLCGPGEALIEGFSLAQLPPFTARYNIAPGTDILAIRHDPTNGRVAELMRWGLVPHWASDASIGAKLVNARAETLESRPAFREAFRRARCIVPANGFYEWKPVSGEGRPRKQPYYLHAPHGGLIAMAGLYARRETSEGPQASCCIVTTQANATASAVHDRMPALLDRAGVDAWLDPASDPAGTLDSLLGPCPDEWLVLRKVAPAVGDARREGIALIEPARDDGPSFAGPQTGIDR